MSLRTASFQATYTAGLLTPANTKVDESTTSSVYKVTVDKSTSTENVAVFTWDFAEIDDTYGSIIEQIDSSTILNMQMLFKHNLSSDGTRLSILKYAGGDPKSQTGANIASSITNIAAALVSIDSTQKSAITAQLSDDYSLYYDSHLTVATRGNITFIIERDSSLDTSIGSIELGGANLVGGTSEWRAAAGAEISDPPLLIITYEVSGASFPVLNMKYTMTSSFTDTPTQSDATNSTGGHISSNDIYTTVDLKESINSTQKTIPVDSDFLLPSTLGLASVGPEIFKYSSTDASSNSLTQVSRGISPGNSFPAGFDSFKIAEKVFYLNDLNALFDTRPAIGLSHYRCVAITNSDTGNDFNIQSAEIGIAQNPDSNVQLRIGIEVPKFDAHTSIAIDGVTATTDEIIVADSSDFGDADGFFDGALIKLLDPIEWTRVDTYDNDTTNSLAVFNLDRSVVGLASGRSFVVMPALSQIVPNDATAPTLNNGLFGGFSENENGISISLNEHGSTMAENDLFYVWIRRTLIANVASSDETGATLIFRFRDI